jgi:hypothetical protein
MDELDDKWIKSFEETDNLYKDFYKEGIRYISLCMIYINKDDKIIYIKQEPFFLSIINKISKEELINIIQKNIHYDNQRFKLFSLLKYNFILDVEDIKDFLLDKHDENYLKPIIFNHDIEISNTIAMFQELNELYFIFKENSNCKVKLTKKNIIKSRKKTIKKSLKA